MIAPISREEFLDVVWEHTQLWREWVKDSRRRKSQAYAILTMCRALYAAKNGEQVSKKRAASWVREYLPEQAGLIDRALEWRTAEDDDGIDHEATFAETERFVQFMIDQVEAVLESVVSRPQGAPMSREQESFNTIASRNGMKISVRAVVLSKGRALVQKPTDDPSACYAFIGGEYEVGDTFVGRLRQEFEEESNAKIVDCQYLFVVENRLQVNGKLMQSLEHYFAVTLDREDIESRERHLSQHWLPIPTLKDYDLRPWIVRDVIAEGQLHSVRHLVVLLDGGDISTSEEKDTGVSSRPIPFAKYTGDGI